MNRRRPLLGLDPVLLTTAQRRYTGAHAPNNPGLAAKRKRNGQRYSPERRRGKVNNHRNEMAYRGDSVDALIKIYGARIGGPDHDPTACEYLAAGPACQGGLRPAVHSKPVPRRARFGLIPDEFFNAYPRTPRWSDGSFTATFWWPYPSAVVHASAEA